MKSNKLKLTISIFSMLLCFNVFAQPPGGQGRPGGRGGGQGQQRSAKPDAAKILSMLDVNNDDVIDKDEASKDRRGKIYEDFDDIDFNEDEVIDLEELKASLNNKRGERKPKIVAPKKLIEEVDDNGDGTLNELEIAAKNKKQLIKDFKAIDTNEDRELDLEELKAFYLKNDKKKRKRKKDGK